jgi:cell division protein FtsB
MVRVPGHAAQQINELVIVDKTNLEHVHAMNQDAALRETARSDYYMRASKVSISTFIRMDSKSG